MRIVGGVAKCVTAGEKWMGVSQKVIGRTAEGAATALLGVYPGELKAGIRLDMCSPVFTATLFTAAKSWN